FGNSPSASLKNPRGSVHVDHPVQERPEQHVREEPSHQPPREQRPPGFKVLVPPPPGLQHQQHGEQHGGQEVEDEAVQAGQAQDPRRGARQRRHRGPAIVQDGGVSPHGGLADELRPLALGQHRGHGCSA
ncbi:hypothetical protein M959_13520, partial [Chaetura pelagica]